VDGECSTNDCVFGLANGASGSCWATDDFPVLAAALTGVCEPLAIAIVRGGEGATKLITIRVTGAAYGRGREDDGAGHRQLAARQDGRARRRPELGPPGGRGRPGHTHSGARPGAGAHRAGRALQQRRAA
jgi:hypothetical protein